MKIIIHQLTTNAASSHQHLVRTFYHNAWWSSCGYSDSRVPGFGTRKTTYNTFIEAILLLVSVWNGARLLRMNGYWVIWSWRLMCLKLLITKGRIRSTMKFILPTIQNVNSGNPWALWRNLRISTWSIGDSIIICIYDVMAQSKHKWFILSLHVGNSYWYRRNICWVLHNRSLSHLFGERFWSGLPLICLALFL